MNIKFSQIKLRLSLELKEKIEASSSKNKRSMNAEIIAAIERSIEFSADGDERINSALESLLAFSIKIAQKEIVNNSLPPAEKKLLSLLDNIPDSKKSILLKAFISISDATN